MTMIYSYNKFLFDEAINEAAFYILPELVKRFKKISSNPVAEKILDTNNTNISADITMLSTAPEDSQFSFLTSRKAIEILVKNDYRHEEIAKKIIAEVPSNLNDINWEFVFKIIKNANSMSTLRIGRFINRVFPGEFTDKQIEEFVNTYKAAIESLVAKFEIVDGLAIDHWYNSSNYAEKRGSLGGSCMGSKNGFFQIYNKNEDVCKLLILKEGDELIGRALIWKIQSVSNSPSQFEYFMDRQYTIEDHNVLKFRKYAEERGWAYKAYNTHSNYKEVSYNGSIFSCNMVIQLGDYKYEKFPYLDTFKRYNYKTHQLFNDNSNIDFCYILDSTEGNYREVGNTVYSEYHGRDILMSIAVENSELGWLIQDECIIPKGRSDWWPRESQYIYNINGEYYHTSDLIWSRKYRRYYLPEVVHQVIRFTGIFNFFIDYVPNDEIVMPEDGEQAIWYKALNLINSLEVGFGFLKNDIIEDYNGNIIPEDISIELFKSKIGYISKTDSKILDEEIDKSDMIVMDIYQYHLDMKDLISKIYNICLEHISEDSNSIIYKIRNEQIRKFNKYLDNLDENK